MRHFVSGLFVEDVKSFSTPATIGYSSPPNSMSNPELILVLHTKLSCRPPTLPPTSKLGNFSPLLDKCNIILDLYILSLLCPYS